MNNKTYDILKYIAQIVLPALGTLYFALASIWGFAYGEQIVGTITAIDAFLGVLLGISSNQYYRDGKDFAGTLELDKEAETADFNFNPDALNELEEQKIVKVKVETYTGKHEAEV